MPSHSTLKTITCKCFLILDLSHNYIFLVFSKQNTSYGYQISVMKKRLSIQYFDIGRNGRLILCIQKSNTDKAIYLINLKIIDMQTSYCHSAKTLHHLGKGERPLRSYLKWFHFLIWTRVLTSCDWYDLSIIETFVLQKYKSQYCYRNRRWCCHHNQYCNCVKSAGVES